MRLASPKKEAFVNSERLLPHSSFVQTGGRASSFPIYVEESGKETLVSSQTALWMKPNATEEEHLQFYRYCRLFRPLTTGVSLPCGSESDSRNPARAFVWSDT